MRSIEEIGNACLSQGITIHVHIRTNLFTDLEQQSTRNETVKKMPSNQMVTANLILMPLSNELHKCTSRRSRTDQIQMDKNILKQHYNIQRQKCHSFNKLLNTYDGQILFNF